MPHSKFGWSYPPGCSGPPDDNDVSPQSEEIYRILETDCSQETIDTVLKIVDELAYKANHCPQCKKLAELAEYELWEEESNKTG